MRVTYVGSGGNDDPTTVSVGDITFRLNVPVTIPKAAERDMVLLKQNRQFRVEDGEAPAPPASMSAEDQAKLAELKALEADLARREAELAKAEIEARKPPVPTPDVFKPPAPGAGAPAHKGGANLPGLPGGQRMVPPTVPQPDVKKD